MDLLAATAGLFLVASVAFVSARRGRVEHARVVRDGGSVLLDLRVMDTVYCAIAPAVRACVRLGISANAVTLGCLGLALGAGALVALGHFGLAAIVAAVSFLGDAVDGRVAAETGTSSPAGEVLDSAADRYSEMFFLGGLAIHYGGVTWALTLTLAALLGAFMVSYSTAKAEAFGVRPPRGAMRRPERATYLTLGALLVPLATRASGGHPWWVGELPMLAALALVAAVANVSAVQRLRVVARAARHQEG